MTQVIDVRGTKFGRLTPIKDIGPRSGSGNHFWKCKCDCGGTTEATGSNLINGRRTSCGCIQKEGVSRTHGMAKTPTYNSYLSAKGRCTNPNNGNYFNYGGRGIEFKFTSFEQFIKELGPKPSSKHSLDREDNEGHYEHGNVRWATRDQQANNRRKFSKDRVNTELLVAYAKTVMGEYK